MFFSKKTKNLSMSNFFFSMKIKWIDVDNFAIFLGRIIFFFRIQRNKYQFRKKFRVKKIFCHTRILNAEISFKKKKKIIISNSDGVLQTKTNNFFNNFQFFFLNFELEYFKEDFFQNQLLYGIGRTALKDQNHKHLKKNFSLVIINLEEGIFFQVYKFKNYWFNENLFCLAEKQKTIFIAQENQLLFFYFDYEEKKIFKSTIFHDFEICFVKFSGYVLVFADKNGYLFLLESFNIQKAPKKNGKALWEHKLLLKKKKLAYFSTSIRTGIFNKNKIFAFLFFRSKKFLIFKLNSKKKKKLNLTKKGEIFEIKNFDGKNEMLFVTADFSFFFLKNKIKWKFLYFRNQKPLNLISPKFFLENKKFFQIQIFPLVFFSKKIFCIFSTENFFEIISLKKDGFRKNSLNSSKFLFKKKPFENSIIILKNFIGKKIFVIDGSLI
ncbi:hypothetical protein HAN_1g58 (nucleomorph) [Hemiselmis andersenii]|uniref:Uncharacterized protein n=1 Tax=Hemiselmis andersenii TaxID=464988 RepID=A9BK70_HEMAN|nr:hypothetical protein HAN_1g58 [Hemiselmis andersenii]ABW97903.1 hypothetical protein HAN_1g58 [Hemiselmis andersenii]